MADRGLTREGQEIIDAQRSWALDLNLLVNRYNTGVGFQDALFLPLPPEVRSQFERAPGNEMQRMHSYRSSSALAVNVFLPWRDDVAALSQVLGHDGSFTSLAFEAGHNTGISEPYLDVLMHGDDCKIAVESKFVEPYDDHARSVFGANYFEAPGLWNPFPELESVARRFTDPDHCFTRLDAAQLVKHAMGLTNRWGLDGFVLLYAWFDSGGPAAGHHRAEIAEFEEIIAGSFAFEHTTYQDLFARLRTAAEPVPGYIAYLARRYFGSVE